MNKTTPLRERMIEDMKLAGLASRTQQTYIYAVRKLADHYRRSPDQLTEDQVFAYILDLQAKGIARGTFKTNFHGIRFLMRHTLGHDWDLFSKKRFVNPSRSAFHRPLTTETSVAF